MSAVNHDPEQLSAADVAERRLCMGCGFCSVTLAGEQAGEQAVEVSFDHRLGHPAPVRDPVSRSRLAGRDFICPGASMDLPALSTQVHGRQPQDELLGHYVALRAGYAVEVSQRQRSASGGIIPVLLEKLFASNAIDAAYCVVNGSDPRGARGAIITDPGMLKTISGSVYHPADFGADLRSLMDGDMRFAFVGLPCEIAALEMLKKHKPDLAARHVMSIGLFCGGINTYDGIGYYLEGFDVDPGQVEAIDYRAGSWPGRIRLRLKDTNAIREIPRIRGNSRWKILRYVIAMQGYWMLPRCRLCPDQVADFADIAVGDPHLPRFREETNDGYSVVVTRTDRGEALLRSAIEAGQIAEQPISRDEVVASQGYTLDNRRHVEAYRPIARLFGLDYPEIHTYSGLSESIGFRHRVYAFVDLLKVALPQNRVMRWFYFPWQIFEYLFVTFTPSLIVKRIGRLLRNK